MPLIYKLRDNDIVDTRLELEQSIINNLSIYFASLPPKFIYKISIVPSITTKDGTNIKGASHQVLTSTTKAGVKKYKTVYNKWAVLDISVKTEGGVIRKLDRIVLAPVDILSYNPTLGDLETQSNSIKLLVSTGTLRPTTPAEQNTTTKPAQASTSAPGTVSAVTSNGTQSQSVPVVKTTGQNASTLFEWYQAQGQTLPSVSARAVIYEGLGLGPAGTYVGSAEQNDKLLTKLKTPTQTNEPVRTESYTPNTKRLGTTQYYKHVVNGITGYMAIGWGGNIPFGEEPISKEEYISGTATVSPKASNDAKNNIGIYAPNYIEPGYEKFLPDAPTPSEKYYTKAFFATLPAQEQTRLRQLYPGSY